MHETMHKTMHARFGCFVLTINDASFWVASDGDAQPGQPAGPARLQATGHRLTETSRDVRFKVKSWIENHLIDVG